MIKQFSTLQLFSVVDGRLSTTMDDVYDILNHVCDENLMTHHLPVALDYLKEKNPKWFQEQTHQLTRIKNSIYISLFSETEPIPFKTMMSEIKEKYNDMVDVPQLKDEMDTSDFGKFMVDNSILLKKLAE